MQQSFQSQLPKISKAREGLEFLKKFGDLSYDPSYGKSRKWHRKAPCSGGLRRRHFESKAITWISSALSPDLNFFFIAVCITTSIKSEFIIKKVSSSRHVQLHHLLLFYFWIARKRILFSSLFNHKRKWKMIFLLF